MKSRILALPIVSIFLGSLIFISCKKINEGTELGKDLIPAIDNINTFQAFLPAETDNKLFNDTTKLFYNDYVAIGHITNDPEFGSTHGNAYFDVSPPATGGAYPFVNKDSVSVDSVVLSLSYSGLYGDSNSAETFRVFEIAPSFVSGFNDTTLYKFSQPDFATTGSQLGSRTFVVKSLSDSVLHVRKRDTTYLKNILRIRLNNSLATRFIGYDTSSGPLGAYNFAKGDSIFKTLFRGLAIKADATGNALVYFRPSDLSNTKLTVYFRARKNGVDDTTSVDFLHSANGQANTITRTPAGNWLTYLNNGNSQDDKLFIQSTPGSYATIKIPALDTFRNSVIHRAELIITKIPSGSDNIFTPPFALFLDKINSTADTAFIFETDMGLQFGTSIGYNIPKFGGFLKPDNTYRFDITRYVQGIVTRREPNYLLRLYAPLRTIVFLKSVGTRVSIDVLSQAAKGRVVLAGGNYATPGARVQLRVVYSKI